MEEKNVLIGDSRHLIRHTAIQNGDECYYEVFIDDKELAKIVGEFISFTTKKVNGSLAIDRKEWAEKTDIKDWTRTIIFATIGS